jgi:hypothetical protein
MPKKHDPKREKTACPRSMTQKIMIIKEGGSQLRKESISIVHHVPLLDQLVNITVISMVPIFDLATEVIQECAFILPVELHFSHLHK